MKIQGTALIVALATTTDAVASPGRFANGFDDKDSTCGCNGPVSLQAVYYDPTSIAADNPQPGIYFLEDAIRLTPPGCILKVPTLADISVLPPQGSPIVPLVKDPALINNCVADSSEADGCRSNWFYLDGTPAPNDASFWGAGVGPNEPIVFTQNDEIWSTGARSAISPAQGPSLTAYYACCLANNFPCAAFE